MDFNQLEPQGAVRTVVAIAGAREVCDRIHFAAVLWTAAGHLLAVRRRILCHGALDNFIVNGVAFSAYGALESEVWLQLVEIHGADGVEEALPAYGVAAVRQRRFALCVAVEYRLKISSHTVISFRICW